MAEVIFNYNGIDTSVQCKKNQNIKDICIKFCNKIQLNIDKMLFIYGGENINLDLSFDEVIKKTDKQRKKMNILVYNKDSTIVNKNEKIIKSKDVICPKCRELCFIEFDNYKIALKECKNNHETIVSLNDYDNTQNIDESKIICSICNNNKNKTYNNNFFFCGICDQNLCPLCKVKHNNDHILMDYENKNYICHKHNEQFISFCNECRINLLCDLEHDNTHKIIQYKGNMPNINNIKDKMKELKNTFDKFNNGIDEIIGIFQNVKYTMK